MKDMVIGCITGYNFEKIKPWVNSLDRSGFTGTKAMICYNIDYETVDELVKRDYSILAFGKDEEKRTFKYPKEDFQIVVERFLHLWYLLKRMKGQYNRIITTDVKDVIFQTNPSIWLDENLGDKEINVACESIAYKDEEWGTNNLMKSFGPLVHEECVNNPIYNAGTISGKFDTMVDLFLNIYMLSNSTNHNIEGGGGPDQAALNVLLQMKTYQDITNFANSEDGWAAQLGTTGPQIAKEYGDKLLEQSPIMKDGMVCTSEGKPFALVHQYDRVPEWKESIEKKFEDDAEELKKLNENWINRENEQNETA
jgi:hypothetical protein